MRMRTMNACARLAAGLTLAVLATSAAVGAGGDPEVTSRLYRIHYLNVKEAELLIRQKCLTLGKRDCDTRMRLNYVEFFSDEEAQAEVAALLKEKDVPPATQVFQVTLVVADNSGEASPALPAGAQRAMDDLLGFLPFRSFRVLDSGMMRTSEQARLTLGGDLGYRAELVFRGDPTSGKPLFIEGFQLEQSYIRYVPSQPGLPAEREEVHRDVMASSFSMEVGETVVVGTSKLDGGDQALVVLLTAVSD